MTEEVLGKYVGKIWYGRFQAGCYILETTYHKRTEEEEEFDKNLYQQAIGCLTYISTAT